MNKRFASRVAVVLVALGVSIAAGAPAVINNMIRLHAQSDSSFPTASPDTLGGVLFGATTGQPYWSPGDGGSWQGNWCLGAGALNGGCITRSGGSLVVDAGMVLVGGNTIRLDGTTPASSVITIGNGALGVSSTSPSYSVSWGTSSNTFFVASGVDNVAHAHYGTWTFESTLNGFNTNIPITSGVGSGTNAITLTTNGARVDFGAGASDYATSDGTTVTFAGPTSSASNVNTGGVFTRSGVEVAQPTITSATSIGTILTANFELGGIRFQAPATFTRFGQTTLVTGVGAGNLTIQVYNVTGAAVVCTRTLACGLALGMSSASCSGTVAAADDVVLRIDASACTTSPVMALTAMYR